MIGGVTDTKTKLPPRSASPNTTNEEMPSAWRWVWATPITRAVVAVMASTMARESNPAAKGSPSLRRRRT